MLTLFASPKAFEGHTGVIQRNAIRSWAAIRPSLQILLMGNDDGVAEIAEEFGVGHIADVATSERGVPLLADMIRRAEEAATWDVLCYTNADIILTSEWAESVQRVRAVHPDAALMCTPLNIPLTVELDTQAPDWEAGLRALTVGRPGPSPVGTDVFVFPRGLYAGCPGLVLGGGYWDNWLMWTAAQRSAMAADLTPSVLVLHQDHGTSSHAAALDMNPNAIRNMEAMHWWERRFRRVDLPYELDDGALKARYRAPWIGTRLASARRQGTFLEMKALDKTYGLRRHLRAYRWWQHDGSR
jgi:hypothetical protein